MQTKYSHIVIKEEIETHPEVFVESVKEGDHVLLGSNDLAILGITKHVVTADDLVNNEGLEAKVGDEVVVPEVSDPVATLVLEAQAQDIGNKEGADVE